MYTGYKMEQMYHLLSLKSSFACKMQNYICIATSENDCGNAI